MFFVGDFGLEIRITVVDSTGTAVDISAATQTDFIFERPDRTTFTRTASFVTTGVDGQLRYVLVSGDLDVSGVWKIRANVIEGATKDFKTEKLEFTVEL